MGASLLSCAGGRPKSTSKISLSEIGMYLRLRRKDEGRMTAPGKRRNKCGMCKHLLGATRVNPECYNKKSDHYGHIIGQDHPACDVFERDKQHGDDQTSKRMGPSPPYSLQDHMDGNWDHRPR